MQMGDLLMSLSIWHTRRALLGALALGLGGGVVAACATTNPPQENVDYRLGPADQLRITVFNEPGLTGQFVIGQLGTIAYPLVGDIRAAGLTASEFSQALREALNQYVRSPSVSVEVASYRPFFILGEVARPGSYPFSVDLTVMNAVATAGGFTYRANRRRVFIRRADSSEERAYDLTVVTPVMPGDTIRIGERLF